MRICVVSFMYPNRYSSSDFVFVKMLVDEFARQGHECVVISPFSISHYRHFVKTVEKYKVGKNYVTVIRPMYISFSMLRFGSFKVTPFLHTLAVKRGFQKLKIKPDIVYCHFWKQGLQAYNYSKKMNIPMFVASGECEIFVNNRDGVYNAFCDYVKGVICVSTKNKDESIGLNLTAPEKCIVAPNSTFESLFKKMDKIECRKKLGLPLDKFIVVFVGSFNSRKGSNRLAEAISRIKEKDVFSMFIGAGKEIPSCNNIIFLGSVKHDELPVFLNSADAFVLPTLQEGCCNAVVEAMSCGLPIISSNLSFNWDVLNEHNSIMIDPLNIEDIMTAIVALRDNAQLRESLGRGSLEMAKNLSISNRASKIINFIESRI